MALTKIKADGLTADLIDETKLADNSIDSEHYNDGSIDNAHLADDAVGVAELSATGTASSSTFLRGDNSWAAVTSTTINNNADNRVITGSGTANTLNGESGLTFDGNTMNLTSGSGDARLTLIGTEGNNARISLVADDGDDHIDQYNIRSNADDNSLSIDQFESGSFVERVTIANGGNVGIGTTSPTAASSETTLNIYANEYPEVHLTSSVTGTAAGDGSIFSLNNDSSTIIRNQENSYIRFDTNGSNERLRIQAGGGISFNGDTAAANALDDYEEGTWTPVPYLSYNPNSRSITLGTSSGSFTKIGRFVFLEYKFRWTAISGSGGYNVGVSNLPFSANNTVQATNGVGRSNMTGYTFVCENLYDTAIGVLRRYDNSSPNENEEIVGFASYFV